MSSTPLPPERAFVVQLRGQSSSGDELFVGRIEHITSGVAGRFACADDLIAFSRQTLAAPATVDDEPGSLDRQVGQENLNATEGGFSDGESETC